MDDSPEAPAEVKVKQDKNKILSLEFFFRCYILIILLESLDFRLQTNSHLQNILQLENYVSISLSREKPYNPIATKNQPLQKTLIPGLILITGHRSSMFDDICVLLLD